MRVEKVPDLRMVPDLFFSTGCAEIRSFDGVFAKTFEITGKQPV
jgi:hypothetical protein